MKIDKTTYGVKYWAGVLVLILFVVYLYAPVFSSEYVWDDNALFIDSPSLRTSGRFLEAITQPILPGTTYFRPVVLATFVAEFSVFGVKPFVSHSVNLVFFILNVLCIALLLKKLVLRLPNGLPVTQSLLVVTFYALHPANIEPAAWVAGRFDLLATTFCLMGLVVTAYFSGMLRALLVGLFFFLAAGSKEMAISFPFAWFLIVIALSTHRQTGPLFGKVCSVLKENKFDVAAILIAGLLYLGARIYFLDSISHRDEMVSYLFVGYEKVLLVFNAIYFYLVMVIFPFKDINPMHPLFENLLYSSVFTGGVGAVLFFYGIYRNLLISFNPILAFFCLGLLSLFPVLHIYPITIGGNIGQERFMAIPLVYFSICLLYIFYWLITISRQRKAIVGKISLRAFGQLLSLAWVILAGLNLLVTVPLWRTNSTLWFWAYEKYPNEAYVQGSLLNALSRSGNIKQADELVAKVLAQEREVNPKIWLQIALHYVRTNQYEKAINALEKAKPKGTPPHELVLSNGISLSSVEMSRESAIGSWFYRGYYSAMAQSLIGLSRFDEALDNIDISLFYQRDYAPANLLKSAALIGLGRMNDAQLYYEKSARFILPEARGEVRVIMASFLESFCKTRSNRERRQELCADQNTFLNIIDQQ